MRRYNRRLYRLARATLRDETEAHAAQVRRQVEDEAASKRAAIATELGSRRAAVEAELARLRSGVEAELAALLWYVRADQAVSYGQVMRVMGAVRDAGLVRVGLVTEPPPDRRR